MKVTLLQMNSQNNKDANLRQAKSLFEAAVAADRPDLIVLPEMFPYHGGTLEGRRAAAETLPGGEAYRLMQTLAAQHRVHVHAGSVYEKDGDQYYNTTVAFDREGRERARYRKIHLFDVVTPDGTAYRESATVGRGQEIVTYDVDGMRVGCTICYDLRFAELYRALAERGAKIIMVPAAFTMMTGKDHWEVLLRARAIETQTYVCAPGQTGTYSDGNNTRACYGNSMVIDPWGHVIARAQDKVGFVSTRIDPAYLEDVRAKMPVHQHRVLS